MAPKTLNPNKHFEKAIPRRDQFFTRERDRLLVAGTNEPEKRLAALPLELLVFDDFAAEEYGWIRAHLFAIGSPIGPNDLLIASIAVVNGLALVTNNTREFSRVPGLKLEDWS